MLKRLDLGKYHVTTSGRRIIASRGKTSVIIPLDSVRGVDLDSTNGNGNYRGKIIYETEPV